MPPLDFCIPKATQYFLSKYVYPLRGAASWVPVEQEAHDAVVCPVDCVVRIAPLLCDSFIFLRFGSMPLEADLLSFQMSFTLTPQVSDVNHGVRYATMSNEVTVLDLPTWQRDVIQFSSSQNMLFNF